MRSWKIGVTVICACFVAMPVFAQSKKLTDADDKAADAAVNKMIEGLPADANGDFDTSKMRMSKKEYMDQIGRSFDMMDKNGDGTIDGNEMNVMQKNNELDDEASKAPVRQSFPAQAVVPTTSGNAVAPVGGIPPANQKDLLNK